MSKNFETCPSCGALNFKRKSCWSCNQIFDKAQAIFKLEKGKNKEGVVIVVEVRTLKEAKEELLGIEMKADDLVNEVIEVHGFRLGKSQNFGCETAEIGAMHAGKKVCVLTFSAVLIEKLKRYEALMPYTAKIVRRKRYLDLESA